MLPTGSDLRALKNLLQALRTNGVTRYVSEGLTLELEAVPAVHETTATSGDSLPSADELSPEEAMFYSAPPLPEETVAALPE